MTKKNIVLLVLVITLMFNIIGCSNKQESIIETNTPTQSDNSTEQPIINENSDNENSNNEDITDAPKEDTSKDMDGYLPGAVIDRKDGLSYQVKSVAVPTASGNLESVEVTYGNSTYNKYKSGISSDVESVIQAIFEPEGYYIYTYYYETGDVSFRITDSINTIPSIINPTVDDNTIFTIDFNANPAMFDGFIGVDIRVKEDFYELSAEEALHIQNLIYQLLCNITDSAVAEYAVYGCPYYDEPESYNYKSYTKIANTRVTLNGFDYVIDRSVNDFGVLFLELSLTLRTYKNDMLVYDIDNIAKYYDVDDLKEKGYIFPISDNSFKYTTEDLFPNTCNYENMLLLVYWSGTDILGNSTPHNISMASTTYTSIKCPDGKRLYKVDCYDQDSGTGMEFDGVFYTVLNTNDEICDYDFNIKINSGISYDDVDENIDKLNEWKKYIVEKLFFANADSSLETQNYSYTGLDGVLTVAPDTFKHIYNIQFSTLN